jgi:PAS domain S-box-containing protein
MTKKPNTSEAFRDNLVDEYLGIDTSRINLSNFSASLEDFPTGVVVTNEAGVATYYNQLVVDILGEVPLESAPDEWSKRFGLYREDGTAQYPNDELPLNAALRGETVEAKEVLQIDYSTHGQKWLSILAKPFLSQDGKIHGVIIFISDITTLKLKELSYQKKIKQMEAASEFQRQIAQIANDPLQILNQVVTLAAQNIGDGCVAALLNLPADKLKVVAFHHTQLPAQKLLYGSLISQEFGLASTIERVVHSGEPLLIREANMSQLLEIDLGNVKHYVDQFGVQSILVVPIKGRDRTLGTLTLFRDRGNKPYTIEDQTFIADIAYRTGYAIDNNHLVNLLRVESSGRRHAEEALELSEARFRSIFTSTGLGIKLLDLDGNILETNPAFQNMLGYMLDELRGKKLFVFWHPADTRDLFQVLERVKNHKLQSYQLEHRLIGKDGSVLWVNVTFTGIKKNERDESLAFIVAIVENITERKRIEAEMARMKSRLQSHVELERLRLAQELHDGPLQDLYSAIYKIESWGNQDETGRLDKINQLKQDLLSIVQGLRSTAKDLRPPALVEFGLEKAIRSHAEEFQEKHPAINISLHLAHDGKILPEDIRLILFRIYQHSIINILRHADACDIDVTFTFDAEEAWLEIRDNGIGFVVPTNWVDLVQQGHYGLAGAVERASLLNGTFTVDSQPGAGTTVRVVIPVANFYETNTSK